MMLPSASLSDFYTADVGDEEHDDDVGEERYIAK